MSLHRARGHRSRSYRPADVGLLKFESPIEEILAATLLGWLDHHGFTAEVRTQVSIGLYRADMVVDVGTRRLVVECDGAEYHLSEVQVRHDKRRDRYCAAKGFYVMRFGGNEINRDPRGCAAEIGMWIRLP